MNRYLRLSVDSQVERVLGDHEKAIAGKERVDRGGSTSPMSTEKGDTVQRVFKPKIGSIGGPGVTEFQ